MKAFKSLKTDFVRNRWRILSGLIALLIVDILQLLIPRVIKHAIDDLTLGDISRHHLLLYGIEILILALTIGGFRYVWRYLLLGAARRVEKELRDRLFCHLQSLPLSYFLRAKVGDLMAHATNDIEAVRMSLAMGLVFLVDTIILGTLTIFFMVYISPLLTLYSTVFMPLIFGITLVSGRVIHQRFEEVQRSFASLTERVREAISGIRVVRAYVQERAEEAKLCRLSQEYAFKNIQITKVWGAFFPILLLFANLSTVIVLYVGGRLTILQSISTGDFVAFISYLGILSWPMMALGWAINVVQRGAASMERLNKIFEEISGVSKAPRAEDSGLLKGTIDIQGLTYRAGDTAEPLLKDIDLVIGAGERIVIAGRTGSGKTTLCNLITRVLEPPRGTIWIGGRRIHHVPMTMLRRTVSYVPQDTFLFSMTIRENIIFGKLDATDREVEQAARVAQIYEEVMEFPEGMETLIGEKGITLSGGQRQRIAIARAILMDSQIFIMDDALSSVDIETEGKILDGLETFLQGRTTLLVTHRVAPLRRADRIVVLDGGRVAEVGDHSALLSRGGIYAELFWRRQLEEDLEREGDGSAY